jgi:hypothetical protein
LYHYVLILININYSVHSDTTLSKYLGFQISLLDFGYDVAKKIISVFRGKIRLEIHTDIDASLYRTTFLHKAIAATIEIEYGIVLI